MWQPKYREPPIVYFDGVCNLCNAAVDFIIRRDGAGVFRFAPLQGPTAQERLSQVPEGDPDTIVVQEDGRLFSRSDAALRIARGLGGGWRLLMVLWWLPRPIRDAIYTWVARNRYRWFGRKETCRLPTPGERARFLP